MKGELVRMNELLFLPVLAAVSRTVLKVDLILLDSDANKLSYVLVIWGGKKNLISWHNVSL